MIRAALAYDATCHAYRLTVTRDATPVLSAGLALLGTECPGPATDHRAWHWAAATMARAGMAA